MGSRALFDAVSLVSFSTAPVDEISALYREKLEPLLAN
jgi:hypothetical protein